MNFVGQAPKVNQSVEIRAHTTLIPHSVQAQGMPAFKLPTIKTSHGIQRDSNLRMFSNTEMKVSPGKEGQNFDHLSIGDVVSAGKGRPQYENGIHYDLSKSHQPYRNNRYQSQWKLEKDWRGTNIDQIFDDGKKKPTPGPSTYKASDVMPQTTKRYQGDKQDRVTFTERIRLDEKQKKGPADYKVTEADKVIKPRLTGSYTIREERGYELNKKLKEGKTLPSPNTYKTDVLEKMRYLRTSNADLNRNKAPRSQPWKKDMGPSPHSYHDGKRDHYNK